jgi:hypothetical protein
MKRLPVGPALPRRLLWAGVAAVLTACGPGDERDPGAGRSARPGPAAGAAQPLSAPPAPLAVLKRQTRAV